MNGPFSIRRLAHERGALIDNYRYPRELMRPRFEGEEHPLKIAGVIRSLARDERGDDTRKLSLTT